jgi:hypothetical protein
VAVRESRGRVFGRGEGRVRQREEEDEGLDGERVDCERENEQKDMARETRVERAL